MSYFLPTSPDEVAKLGWKQLDIIIVTGDAYVDHPSFGPVLIARFLLSKGYKVGIISQPDWQSDTDFLSLGTPRLFFGISSGNMDSMINHYTAQRKIRSTDAYSPDGKMGLRPNRATIVYSQKIRSLYKDVPIVLGGVEASLRRLPHYDFWSDKIRNSILFDSRADILVYGMGEKPILEVVEKLDQGMPVSEIQTVQGTVVSSRSDSGEINLGEYKSEMTKNQFWKFQKEFIKNHLTKKISYQFSGKYLIHNIPAKPLSGQEMDEVYNLPFQRKPHPKYGKKTIPAFVQIQNSITSHRGCFGGCNFCSIGLHQGKTIQSRSEHSILHEIRKMSESDDFNGTVSDIGGPSANMYAMFCKLGISQKCPRRSCLYPEICEHLETSHKAYKKLLQRAERLENVKHVFVSSGIRFDLALQDTDFIKKIAESHVQGLLKLAPEHKSKKVLHLMNKPSFELYERFGKFFGTYSQQIGKKQYIVPYIIIGHPGADFSDTIELAIYLKRNNIKLKQVQEFTPTPMTESTLMYFTEKDLNGNSIHVPKGREIRLMKSLILWYEKENRKYIIEALKLNHREDLIDFFLK
ncbi:MAG TPA: YgiQ family radical SAM protein [Candidatus Cloacimonadota bacterium]|nr:YgiQ family radical SAM protein [Candidatus Cloacimonadota bacterium]